MGLERRPVLAWHRREDLRGATGERQAREEAGWSRPTRDAADITRETRAHMRIAALSFGSLLFTLGVVIALLWWAL